MEEDPRDDVVTVIVDEICGKPDIEEREVWALLLLLVVLKRMRVEAIGVLGAVVLR